MAQVLIRELQQETLQALKRRARKRNRSLQQEMKRVLEAAAAAELAGAEEIADRIYKRLQRGGLSQQDSGELQAQDRLR
jgi:plasmid stability protein